MSSIELSLFDIPAFTEQECAAQLPKAKCVTMSQFNSAADYEFESSDDLDKRLARLDLPKFYFGGYYNWCNACPDREDCDRDMCTFEMPGGLFRRSK